MANPKKTVTLGRLFASWERDLLILGLVLSFLVPVLIPVTFRSDDVQNLAWAARHSNPLDALVRSEAQMYSVYRPVQNLTWWAMYRAFGLEPYPYQEF